ncbi:MAG: MATE family efflux transporter, partial [Thermoguttaceae bacterium]
QSVACFFQILQNLQLKYYGEIYGKSHNLAHGADVSIMIMGILFSTFMLFLMPLLGLGQGMQPIVGYNIGAKNFRRVEKTLSLGLICSLTFSLICFISIIVKPELFIFPFVKWDSPERTEIIALGVRAFRLVMIMLPGVGIAITASNYFQSSGSPTKALILTLVRQVVILVPALLILPGVLTNYSASLDGLNGLDGVWLSFPLSDCGSITLAVAFLFFEFRRLRRLQKT